MAPKLKLQDILRSMDIFEELAQPALDKLSRLVRERKISENTALFRRGDPGDAMFIVQEGRVKILTSDSLGREKVLAFYGENGFFGDMALLTGEPRTATAVAATDTRVLQIRKVDFDKLLDLDPTIAKEMLKVVAQRQAATGRRVADREGDGSARGKVYTFFGPRGGGGRTTLAVNLAVALAAEYPDRTVILDLDVTFGHVPIMLDVTPRASLAAVSGDSLRTLDRESMQYYLVGHESSLRIFAGSTRPEEGEAVSGEHVRVALGQLRRSFAQIVMDTAGNFTETTLAALEEADQVAFVVNPDPAALRDARECIRIFTDLLRMPAQKFTFVLNHNQPYKAPSREEIQQMLGVPIPIEVPYGGDLPTRAALRGEAFVLKQSGSPVARSIEALRRELERRATEVAVGVIGSA